MREDHHEKEPISISLVAKSQKYIAPIEHALSDLGCLVEFIPEQDLSARRDAVEKNDLCFLVYSKIVHFYINSLINSKKTHGRGKTILLCTDKVDNSLKMALTDLGIGRTIDFPYPPVEIFKAVLDTMQKS